MRQNSPSITDVLIDIGGYAFVLGFLAMAAAPFAFPALVFGMLLLPVLLPFVLVGLLYAMVALPRRYFATRRRRSRTNTTAPAQRFRELST